MEYTKGEWTALDTHHVVVGRGFDLKVIANCHERPEAKANAQLISAAPDLYEACKMLIEHMTMPKEELGRPYLADVRREATKALAKAEGK